MGKTFKITTLEEMCDLMCGNIEPNIEYERGRQDMYECFHCGEKAVSWDGDFDFADYGEEGEGIIHECHCNNCGAEITYRIPLGGQDE